MADTWGENDKPVKAASNQNETWGEGDSAVPASGLRKVGDLGLSVAKGVVAVPEALVGLADIPTGGRVGKFLENEGGAFGFRPKQAKEYLGGLQSDDLRDKQQQFQKADGIIDKAGVALSNPSLITNAVAESVPLMGAGIAPARAALAVAPKLGTVAAGAIGEGVVGAGSAAEGIRQETADGLMTAGQSGLALASGAATSAFGFAGGKLAQRLGIGDVDTMLTQGAIKTAGAPSAKSIPRQVVEGAIAEGWLEELPQSVSEQVLQNLALDKPWHEGVSDAAVMGTLAGMAMGGGAAGVSGFAQDAPPADAQQPPAAPPAPPQPQAGPALALPAPDPGVIAVGGDGTARTPAYQKPSFAGEYADVTDVVPRALAPQPADPVRAAVESAANSGGALSPAALVAIDSGVTPRQEGAFEDAPELGAQPQQVNLDEITDPYDRAYYEALFDDDPAPLGAPPVLSAFLQNDDDIPDFDAANNVSEEDFLRALGADEQEIQDAIATTPDRAESAPEGAALPAGPQANVTAGTPEGAGAGAEQPAGPVADAPTNLRDALARVRAQKQGAANAQAATPQAAPAATAVPSAGPGAVEAAGSATTSTTIGVASEPQTDQTQQASTQPAQAGPAQPAQGLTDAAPAQNPGAQGAPAPGAQAQTSGAAQGDKAKWIKAAVDKSRLNGSSGVQLTVTPQGEVTFSGDPRSTKEGKALLATYEEALRAGATKKEIADALMAASGQGVAQKAAGREGYDTPVELDAARLKAIIEQTRGAPLVDKPAKLEAWRNGTAQTDPAKFPIELAFTPDGRLDVNDGRHRIALAAERGEKVTAFIDGKDAQRAQVLASQSGNAQTQAQQAQAATESGAPAETKEQRAKRVASAGAMWTRMTVIGREALVARAPGLNPVQRKRVPSAAWDDLHIDIQRKLADTIDGRVETGGSQAAAATADVQEPPSRTSESASTAPTLQSAMDAAGWAGETGQAWGRMPPAEREDVLKRAGWRTNAGGLNVVGKRLMRAEWSSIVAGTQDTIGRAMGDTEKFGENQPVAPATQAQPAIENVASTQPAKEFTGTKKGDFYEVEGDNAKEAARILDLTLTKSRAGVPIVGWPYHAHERNVAKLAESGISFKMEDPATHKDAGESPAAATQQVADDFLPEGWTKSINGYTKRPVYRMEQGGGQPFAVVTQVEGMQYEVQIRHGDKQLIVSNQTDALSEVLSKAEAELTRMTQADSVTHQDPGEKAEAATPGVVTDSLKKAARNEDTKPSEMRKWLVAEIDKELLQAADRPDYDEAVKRMGEKDATSMFTGNGRLGKNSETGYITFDVPGDGKYKVRNSVRGLLEFRKNVMASQGFKDGGQKRAKPEQNDGVQGGSGGQMAAITNMIEEGDFEAASDYAEAVGIARLFVSRTPKNRDVLYAEQDGKLREVTSVSAEQKAQWERFMRDGTLPPAPWMPSKEWQFQDIGASSFVPESEKRSATLTRVADGSTYVATVKGYLDGSSATYALTKDGKEVGRPSSRNSFTEVMRMAEDAMPEANDKPAPSKASDTGWNMAGTGYGGKRYRGRNITTADGREIVARVYENAGNYDEVEVKVDGVRKFTVRDSYNAQDKADAFVRTVTGKAAESASSDMTPEEAAKYLKDFVYSLNQLDGMTDRAQVLLSSPLGKSGRDNLLMEAFGLNREQAHDINNRIDARQPKKLRNIDMQDAFDVFPSLRNMVYDAIQQAQAKEQKTPPQAPAIPEGYKPAGEPFYRGGKQIQGYAPFTIGERVTMKDSAGQSGVIESLASPDDSGVFASAVVKFDNGLEQMVQFGKLEAAAPQPGTPAQTQATGPRRDPTKVSMFNPYEDGDIVTIDGQDWTVKQDTPGWYLTNTGNWRGQHPTIRNVKAMADLIRAVEQAAVAQPAEAQPDTPKLTPAEAKALMAWEDLGQKDGVKTHALTFYESQADKDAKRGRMIVAKVSKGDRSATAWMVDGEDKTFGMLAHAKKLAEEVGMARAVADGFVGQGTTKQTVAATSGAPIEDAGEKIGGARKDRWKERGLNLDDLDAMTEAEGAEMATKANVWKPDYEALSEASEPVTAAMVKTIYDQLAAKPKKNTPEGRRQYVQMMRIVRDVLTEAKGPDAVRNAYLEIRKRAGLNSALPAEKSAGRELLFSVYKGRSDPFVMNGADLMKVKKMVEDGFPAKGEPWKTRLTVGRREGGNGTTERGIEMYMELSAEVGTPLTREQIEAGFFRVQDKKNQTVAFAATKEDAEAAAATVYERDMKGKKDSKPEPVRPNLDELKRENLPQRIDRDVTSEDFVRDLGFRGVEFGNWSAQDERQRILNMAYDGLMDLAEIMGVPPKAMSLNGTLGMAFGARGGGRFAAHYEPGKLVINMTKIRGGGSMAHEWAHAMDHYFGELDKPDAYTTQARGASGWYSEDQYLGVPRKRMERVGNEWKNVEKMRLDNLRPEMAAAFDEVMRGLFKKQITKAEMVRSLELDLERTEALARSEQVADLKAMYQNMVQNKRQALDELRGDPEGTMYAGRGRTDYANQAQALSGKSVDGYWVRPTEMFARAFESWVFDRVTAMGAKSDYLVHGVEEDRFAGGAYRGNPYPTGEERARINAAFDKLAQTIKTKETDKGVAMFSSADSTLPAKPLSLDRVNQLVQEALSGIRGTPPVKVTANPADIGLKVPAGSVGYGVTLRSGDIYVFQSAMGSDLDVFKTVFHELFHRGVRVLVPKAQYVQTMLDLAKGDSRIQQLAIEWKNTEMGQKQKDNLRQQGYTGAELTGQYEALAIEEALAAVAEEIKAQGRLGSKPKSMTIRFLANWLAKLADLAGMKKLAQGIRAMTYNEAERFVMSAIDRSGEPVQAGRTDNMSAKQATPGTDQTQTEAAFSRGTNEAMTNNDVVGNQGGRSADDTTPGDLLRKLEGTQVVDPNGAPLLVYHGSKSQIDRFDASKTIDGGLHFGSKSQASMRSSKILHPAYLYAENLRRSKDTGSNWKAKIASAKAAGYDGIVYLNRYEGVSKETVFRLHSQGLSEKLDRMSDAEFRRAVPEAEDSYIVFDAKQVIQQNESSAPDSGGAAFSRTAIGNNGDFDPANADIRFRSADMGTQSAWDAPTPTGFDDVIYKLQDKNIDLKRVLEAITKSVGKVADSINAYLKEELFHKRAAKRVADFGARELKPLMNQMRLAGLSMEDVEEYLHARHATEANAVIAQRNPGNAGLQDGGSGMTNQAADNYFAKIDPAQRKKLEAVAKNVDAIIADTRKLYVSYGLEDQAVVDGWSSMYQHYIPLMREDKEGGMGTGQGFSVKGKETKGRTGSTRKVVDVLANIASQRERLIVRGEKNRVTQALVGLAQANPNAEFWEVRSQAPTERVFDPKTGVVVDRPDPLFKSRDNVIVAKVQDAKGSVTEQMVVFNEDNPRAVRMAAAMKNLDAGNLEGLLGMSAKITRYFSAINTQYNPVFGVVNLVRDVQGAMVNLAATPLAGQQGKIAKDTMSALVGIYSDIRKTRKGGQATSQWSQLWEQMQDDGGTTGYRELFTTSADRANNLKSILNPEGWMDNKWGKFFTAGGKLKVPMSMAQKGASEIFGWLSDYNEAMENGVRLAAYKAALDKGMSREQAASLAKNLTVNFNRKGQVGQQAGAVYAFFNAAMQGTARIGQTLFDIDGGDISTLRLSKTGKAVVYGGVTLGAIQALALAGAGFDDEDPPEFVRERSLIIPTGGKTYVAIPMPLGLHVIPGIGRHAAEFALSGFDKPAKRAVSMVGMFADAFNPIGNAGLSMQTIAPTALDPLAALTENKDWTGKPIARVSSNRALPGHTQWKDTATGFSKVVAEAINWVSGGNEYVAGALSPTPDQIDYLLAQVGGGVAREAAKVQQTITTALSGEALPTHKVPLLGRFVGNAASQASQGSAFYANLNKLNELETEIKGLRKDGRFDEAAKLARENPQATMIVMANRAERDVQKLRRDKRELIAKDASREEVRAKEEQITAVMMRLNEAAERRKAQANQ